MATLEKDVHNIFRDERLNEYYRAAPAATLSLGFFFPRNTTTFKQDVFSKLLVDIKDTPADIKKKHPTWSDEWISKNLIIHRNQVMKWAARIITSLFVPGTELVFVAVPSSKSNNPQHGATLLTRLIARTSGTFTDGTRSIIRHTDRPSAHEGGPRNQALDLETLRVENPEQLQNKVIILIDDVITSGNAMAASRYLLMQAGASKIISLTLGRTARYSQEIEPNTMYSMELLKNILQTMPFNINKYDAQSKTNVSYSLKNIVDLNYRVFSQLPPRYYPEVQNINMLTMFAANRDQLQITATPVAGIEQEQQYTKLHLGA